MDAYYTSVPEGHTVTGHKTEVSAYFESSHCHWSQWF